MNKCDKQNGYEKPLFLIRKDKRCVRHCSQQRKEAFAFGNKANILFYS